MIWILFTLVLVNILFVSVLWVRTFPLLYLTTRVRAQENIQVSLLRALEAHDTLLTRWQRDHRSLYQRIDTLERSMGRSSPPPPPESPNPQHFRPLFDSQGPLFSDFSGHTGNDFNLVEVADDQPLESREPEPVSDTEEGSTSGVLRSRDVPGV